MSKSLSLLVTALMVSVSISIPFSVEESDAWDYPAIADLTFADASFWAGDITDRAGVAVEIVGDINDDGYDDMLIGAESWRNPDQNWGRAFIYLGGPTGTWGSDTQNTSANTTINGVERDFFTGGSMARAGDLNGDGLDDFLLGSPIQYTTNWGDLTGVTSIFFGNRTRWTKQMTVLDADAWYIGAGWQVGSASSISGDGDLNGDGYSDFIVNSPNIDDVGPMEVGLTYVVFGKTSGWGKNVSLADADASFLGTKEFSYTGRTVAIVGDVNGDHLDDFVISSSGEDRSFLILGHKDGWGKEVPVTQANTTFTDEYMTSGYGAPSRVGDVNGDGLDDILISNWEWSNGSKLAVGKACLFFGRTSWPSTLNLTSPDVVFFGEWDNEHFAIKGGGGGGDMNGDGYDDIVIGDAYGASGVDQAGIVLVFAGRGTWPSELRPWNAELRFNGERDNGWTGSAFDNGGDVDNDGYDDLLLGSCQDMEDALHMGQSYLIHADKNDVPSPVSWVRAYWDPAMTKEVGSNPVPKGSPLYVQLGGFDNDIMGADVALVKVTSDISSPNGFVLRLLETGPNTGIFTGNMAVQNRTHEDYRWINASNNENVTISSVSDPTKNVSIIIIEESRLVPFKDNTTAQEDQLYSQVYSTVGDPIASWVFETNASWLAWNSTTHEVRGTPDNGDVDSYFVRVNITSILGAYDEHNFTIVVNNSPPNIITSNVTSTSEDSLYTVDYASDDDGNGTVTWHLATETNTSWLHLNSTTGVLNGTPDDIDLGSKWVNVSVDDGNGGWDWTNFTLTVTGSNDAPVIDQVSMPNGTEHETYRFTFTAKDPDKNDKLFWNLVTNASWAGAIYLSQGIIMGVPSHQDPGWYWVNATVRDTAGESDSVNLTVNVSNVNDIPEVSIPSYTAIELVDYNITVTVYDNDPADTHTFFLFEGPDGMTLDRETGQLHWIPGASDDRMVPIEFAVDDGSERLLVSTNISVLATEIGLSFPENGSIQTTLTPNLGWSYPDYPNITFDLYLGTDPAALVLLEEGITGTAFNVSESLADATVYHWRVVPRNGEYIGNSSPIWNFEVDLGIIENLIDLEFDRYDVRCLPGDEIIVNVTLKNAISDTLVVDLLIESGLGRGISATLVPNVTLPAKSNMTIPLRITVSKDVAVGEYDMMVNATSSHDTDKKTVTINVEEPPKDKVKNSWVDPLSLAMIGLFAAIAFGGILFLATRRKRAEKALADYKAAEDEVEDFEIDQILWIYQDGRLISHVSRKATEIDQDIFGSMLIAIQSFVKDSFKADEGLSSFEFGSRKLILEKGRLTFLVVAISGTAPKTLKVQMQDLVNKVEGLYIGKLEGWDGSMGEFKDVGQVLTPLFLMKTGMKIRKKKETVSVKSGVEFYGGYVRLKVGIENDLATSIKAVKMNLRFNEKTLRLSHIEPEYPMRGNTVLIDMIKKDEKTTVAIYLDPVICQSSHIDCTVEFTDEFGLAGTGEMKTRVVDVVCPLFYTPETINVAMLKRLISEVRFKDSRVFRIAKGSPLREAFEKVKKVVLLHDVKMVRQFVEDEPFVGEAWFYGKVSEGSEEIVMKTTIRADMSTLEVFVGCNNLAGLTGLLAEMGNKIQTMTFGKGDIEPSTDTELRKRLEAKGNLLDRHVGAEAVPKDDDLD